MCEVLLAAFYLAAFLLFCAAVFFFAELWFSPSRWECIAYVFGIASAGGKSGRAFFLRVAGVMVMFFSAARWMFSADVQRK